MDDKKSKRTKEAPLTDQESHGAGDSRITKSGDSMIPESGDSPIPESGDSMIPESGDSQIPECGDSPRTVRTDTDIPWYLRSLPRELAVSMLRNDVAATSEYLATHTLPDDVVWGDENFDVLSWLDRHGSPEIWTALYTSYLESRHLPRELVVAMLRNDVAATAEYLATHTLPDDVVWGDENYGVLSWLDRHGSPEMWTALYTSYFESRHLPRELVVAMLRNDAAATAEYLATHTLPDDVEWEDKDMRGVLRWLDKHGSPEMWAALYTSPTVPFPWELRSLPHELAVSMLRYDAAATAEYLATHTLPDDVVWGDENYGVLSWLDRHGGPEMWTALYTSYLESRHLPRELALAVVRNDVAATAEYLATHTLPDDVEWKGQLGRGVLRWLEYDGSPEMWAALYTSPTVPLPWELRIIPRELAVAMLRNDAAATEKYLATYTLTDDVVWEVGWEAVVSWVFKAGSAEIRAALAGSSKVPLDELMTAVAGFDNLDSVRFCLSFRRDEPGWADALYACYYWLTYPYPRAAVELIATDGPLYSQKLVHAVVRGDLDAVLARREEFPGEETREDRLAATCLLIIAQMAGHSHVVDGLVQARLVSAVTVYRLMVDDNDDDDGHDLVQRVLRQCQDLDVCDENQLTPLHVAAACWLSGDLYLRLLLSRGVTVDLQDAAGRTPLHIACREEWKDEIDALVQGRTTMAERVERRDKLVKPPGGSYMDVTHVRMLLKAGAQVDVEDVNGQTPLHSLCSQPEFRKNDESKREACRLLLKHGAQINKQDAVGMTPVAYAAVYRNHVLIAELINGHADVNIVDNYGQSPLIHCVENSYVDQGESSHLQAAQALFNHPGINVNHTDRNGNTALSLAVGAGDTKMVKLLLQHGADPAVKNKDGETAIHRVKDVEIAELLIQRGAKVDAVNSRATTILHIAADNHNLDLLKLLIGFKHKAINARNHLGRTPLHNVVFSAVHQYQANLAAIDKENLSQYMAATESKFKTLIEKLIQKGADINIKDQKGESPIAFAVTNPALLKILLEFNADIRTENTMGRGLIHMLVEKIILSNIVKPNTSQIIEFLQSHIDINQQDIWKQTPLHVAVSSETPSIELIKILLERGSDVQMRDSFGLLPISYAVPHPDVFNLLWDRSLPHITDNDFENLRILAHCQSVNDKTLRDKIKCELTEEQYTHRIPQNFIRPSGWQSNVDLNEWYKDEQTFNSFEDFFKGWLNSLQRFTYVKHTKIVETLTSFIKDVLADVSRRNPLVACEFRLSGSETEGTKIIATNEVDALSVLTFITIDKFENPTGPGHPILKEFVHLVCKEAFRKELEDVLDENFQLSRDKVYQHYSEALSAALANPALWAKYPCLQRITNHDIVASNRTITPMTVMWHDDVYPLLVVDVDMVLAVDLPQDFRPSWASNHPLLNKVKALIVPKWKTAAPEDEILLEMGVSHWSEVFSKMPPEMKHGYRLAKVVKEICPSIKNENGYKVHHFLNSYMFKMAIVELYATVYLDRTAEPPQANSDDRDWALAIYKYIEQAIEKQDLSSFFIRGYNLLFDAKFAKNRTLAIAYSRLCQKMLTPEAARHFHVAYMGLDPEPVVSGQSKHQ